MHAFDENQGIKYLLVLVLADCATDENSEQGCACLQQHCVSMSNWAAGIQETSYSLGMQSPFALTGIMP